jgi:single-strand DNA-binding protein
MAKSLNKVMLIGNLGKDPEVRYTPGGVAVASFSIATNESWKDQEGNLQERTEWHNIVAWKRLAEISGEYLKKGRRVYIEGRIQTRSYDDKNTGAKKYITEIVANDLIMLDGGSGAGGGAGRSASSSYEPPSQQGGAGDAAPGSGGQVNDDLPF